MIDHRFTKLGKKSARFDARTLKLERYLSMASAPPNSIDWTGGVTSWGMMLNDRLGDCTIAACGHAVQAWTKVAKTIELTLPDWVIEHYYEAWDGYNPADPSTDQGGYELDVLNYWRKYGFGYRSNKKGHDLLLAYADPTPGNQLHVKQSIALFGGVYIGLALPITAQNQMVWDVVNKNLTGNSAPGSWGGHAVWCPKYDATGVTCITWGGLQKMTWAFWNAYCDESHTLLSPDFMKATNVSASGFDLTTLKADLALIVG